MLSNLDIEGFAAKRIKNFQGVFSRDALPQGSPNGSYVINMQGMTQGDRQGTHWVALWQNPTMAYYFDPFGVVPPTDVIEFIGDRRFFRSSLQVQDIKSDLCGVYCLYWLWWAQRCGPMCAEKKFVWNKPKANEDILHRWWLQHTGKRL